MKEKSLAKNAIFNIIYKVLNIVFPLISSTYIARVILPTGVGTVAYVQNIVSYFTMFAALGIPSYGIRIISQKRDNPSEMAKAFTELLIINFISTSICLLAYIVLVSAVFKDHIDLYVVCGLEILFNYINIDWLYQGLEEYSYIAVRSSIIKILSICALFLFVTQPDHLFRYAVIVVIATGGNHFFNIVHSRKVVKVCFKGLSFKEHISPIFFLTISVIAAEFYSKIDITMLGSGYSKDVVGYYSNSQKLVNLALTIPTAITAIFLPRMSYYFQQEREKYNELLTLGVRILLFVAVPCCLGIILVADSLVPVLFGEAFMPAAVTIRILAPLILIKGFGDLLCYQVVISSGQEKELISSYILSAVTNVVLNALLIPRFIQNGAAFASVMSELLLNAILFWRVSRKIIHVHIERAEILKYIVSYILMFVSVILLPPIQNVYVLLALQVITGVIVYFAAAVIMKNPLLNMFYKKLKKEY